jgi:precorrin-6B methylase 1
VIVVLGVGPGDPSYLTRRGALLLADADVVAMGDVHFSGFQLLERVETVCGHTVDTESGISSAQILASRARVAFDDTTFVTFHRRGDLAPFRHHLSSAPSLR